MFVLFTTLFTTSAPVILGGLNIKLTSEICNDGIDNDNDGDFDLDDSDCAETNCIDGIDNNFNFGRIAYIYCHCLQLNLSLIVKVR